MVTQVNDDITTNDKAVLRDLARRVAEIAALPEIDTRRRRWYAHNSLDPSLGKRPMMLIFPEGAWQELLPPEAVDCQGSSRAASRRACASGFIHLSISRMTRWSRPNGLRRP